MPSVRVTCPYCSAKLRAPVDGGPAPRLKCRTCKRTFTPAVAIDAPAADPLTAPLAADWAAPPAATDPPAPVPLPDLPPVEPPAAPADAAPPAAGSAPAGRRRRRERLPEEAPPGQLRPYEVVLASALILAVVGGLGILGYQLYATPAAADRSGGDDADRPPADTYTPPVADLTPKERPKRLFGAWDLRSDDGRNGRLVLRPDGTLVAASTAGDSPLPDYNGRWFLLSADGNRYELEFGQERGGLDGYRVILVLTSPDAFTLIQTVRNGIVVDDPQRFVRATPAAKAPDGRRAGP